jgi:uncharacterized DUF497 family protein
VRFTWDPRKSGRNLALRGFDFTFAATIFAAPTLERTDTRRDYGEVRRIGIGRTHGVCLTVVYTDRLDADRQVIRRIISARRSKRREYRDYAKAYPKS